MSDIFKKYSKDRWLMIVFDLFSMLKRKWTSNNAKSSPISHSSHIHCMKIDLHRKINRITKLKAMKILPVAVCVLVREKNYYERARRLKEINRTSMKDALWVSGTRTKEKIFRTSWKEFTSGTLASCVIFIFLDIQIGRELHNCHVGTLHESR